MMAASDHAVKIPVDDARAALLYQSFLKNYRKHTEAKKIPNVQSGLATDYVRVTLDLQTLCVYIPLDATADSYSDYLIASPVQR
jgi:hypothetical protein